jgi:hypothetical protein
MRTVVEIDSNTAARLLKLAEAKHVSVEELLATYVPGLTEKERVANGSSQDRTAAFDEWVADFAKDSPPLPEEAISRASIYRDR